jgi:hypothetical protein
VAKFGVKLFAREGEDIPLPEFIPVFHRCLRDASVSGTFIDVADYSHVPEGPGILLIGHEGNLSIDGSGPRRGLRYQNKRSPDRSLPDSLFEALGRLLEAAIVLERDPPPGRALGFDTGTLQVCTNDRLHSSNDERGRAVLERAAAALAALYGAAATTFEVATDEDSRELMGFCLRSTASPSLAELKSRLSA